MRAWPSDATVAHLIFTDHQHVPHRDEIAEAIEHATRKGARAVRTSAMFPDVTAVVIGNGFVEIDRLALLVFDLSGPLPDRAGTARTGSMRPWHSTPCSQIDREAFGLMWGNTPASLRDIRAATPWHHARVARADRRVVGFAMSGAAADQGYLQRLAVAAEARRRGIARDLVVDALAWMRARDLNQALVNTGVGNEPALTLYQTIGFRRLTDELVIGERRLT
jgi:ribosomal protein S18 acetylase RimI-like enzyme